MLRNHTHSNKPIINTRFIPNHKANAVKGTFNIMLFVVLLTGFLQSTALAQQPIKVNAVSPNPIEQSQTIELSGTVEAKHQSQLATLESGRVKQLSVEVGDVVSKGQELLRLDSELAELQVVGAAAEVKAAELNLQESKRLYEEVQRLSVQQAVAKTLIAERAALLANAEAQLAQVNASHRLQQERLNRHSLKAPFDGVIAVRHIDLGEWITPQDAAFTLVDQGDLRLTIEIPQQYYNTLRHSAEIKVNVLPDASGVEPFVASLSRLVPVSDSQTRTLAAQIDLPDSESSGLVPGMSANAVLTFPDSLQHAVLLPRSAIKNHPDGNSSVFVVENNRAKRVVTDYKTMSNGQVAVYNQPPNQVYVVTGVELLTDGQPVNVNLLRDEES